MMGSIEEVAGGPLIPEGAPPAFHLLAKPTGAICNLDRTYPTRSRPCRRSAATRSTRRRWGSTTSTSPPAITSGPGHIQLVGKSNAQAMRGEKPKLTMLSRNGR
jgi:hypothetical protein